MQDNLRSHCTQEVKVEMARQNYKVLNHPPTSPDLNQIENVWMMVERRLSHYLLSNFINSKTELFQKICEFGNEIPVESINKLFDSMPKRIEKVIESNGKAIKY